MQRFLRIVPCVVLAVGVGCGGGSGSEGRNPPSAPTPAIVVTATPQPTPLARANAWAVGARFEPIGSDGAFLDYGIMLRSSDAGAHWTETYAREHARFLGVSFADDSRGWVVGSDEILRSDDGGLDWISVRAAVPIELFVLQAVQAVSRDVVVAVGGGAPILGSGDAPSLILRTEDGGATWTVPPCASGGGGDPSRSRLGSVCITPAGTGLAIGAAMNAQLAVHTADYGASWIDVTLAVQGSPGGGFVSVACNEDELWVLTNGRTSTGELLVRYSPDGAGQWLDVGVPADANAGLTSIGAPARGVAVAVGLDEMNQPLIVRTDDVGITWRRQPIDGSASGTILNAVSFAGPDDGTTVGGRLDDSAPAGSLTALSSRQGPTWTVGQPVGGFVYLWDVERIP